MKVVLEINNEVDLTVLLPLLERLKIPFTFPNQESGKKKSKSHANSKAKMTGEDSTAKNFDLERLEILFNELQEMKAFSQIDDPASWQRQIRDEWN